MSSFTRKPKPRMDAEMSLASEEELASFIDGASCHTKNDTPQVPRAKKTQYPWEEPFLQSQHFTRGVSFRLSEIELRKLKYLSDVTRISQAKFVSAALDELFDKEFKKLGIDHRCGE